MPEINPAEWYNTVRLAVSDSGLLLKHVLVFAGVSFVVYKFLALWKGR